MSISFPEFGGIVTMSCDQPNSNQTQCFTPLCGGAIVTYVYDKGGFLRGPSDPLGMKPMRAQKPRKKRAAKPKKPRRPKEAQP